MAKKQEAFPKKLFVYREQDGSDSYLLCFESERECADINEERLVGVYELKEVGNLSVEVVQVKA